MEVLLKEYLRSLIFLGLAFALVCAMLGGSYLIARQNRIQKNCRPSNAASRPSTMREASSTYFLSWSPSSSSLFDLEWRSCFPLAVTLGEIGIFGFWSMMLFLGVLTIGFVYEWRKGALEWE